MEPQSPANPISVSTPDGAAIAFGKGAPLAVIAGPCVIESRDHALFMADKLSGIARRVGIPLVYKSSYDKANRTSAGSFRGMGLEEGLRILEEVRREHNLPVLTDVHTADEARQAGETVDIVQIPAFLCRQTDLLRAAGAHAKTVLVKKGQFLHPNDMQYAVQKVVLGGCSQVLLCERGTCFGYRDLIVDMRGLALMADSGCPVVFDATHSVQSMGGAGGSSGGSRQYVPLLARAAIAAGVDALFLECHQDPDRAPSDGPNMLPLEAAERLLGDCLRLSQLQLDTRAEERAG